MTKLVCCSNRPLNNSTLRYSSQRGAILILVAVLLIVFLSLIALQVVLGFFATESSRLQAIANIGAMSAIENYIRSRGDDESDKRTKALDRANLILQQNSLQSTRRPLGDVGLLTPGPGGTLTFGRFFQEDPGDACDGEYCDLRDLCNDSPSPVSYPCFVEYLTGADESEANAVRLDLRTQADNPVMSPMRNIFGLETFQLEQTATAAVVDTCFAFLLDVSVSTVAEGHPNINQMVPQTTASNPFFMASDPPALMDKEPAYTITSPVISLPLTTTGDDIQIPSASLFAFDVSKILDSSGNVRDCSSLSEIQANHPELTYWCNMPDNRAEYSAWALANNVAAPFDTDPPPQLSFRSDYILRPVMGGIHTVLVNKYRRNPLHPGLPDLPNPMSNFFLGYNAALRWILKNGSDVDRGLLMAFTGDVQWTSPLGPKFDRVFPEKIYDADEDKWRYQLTSQLGFLTQLTRMDILGVHHPNETVDSTTGYAFFNPPPGPGETIPNLLDYGFFVTDPRESTGPHAPLNKSTNLVRAVFDAVDALTTVCTPTSRKMIILATDGLSSCYFAPDLPGYTGDDRNHCGGMPGEGDAYNAYTFSEYWLLKPILEVLQTRGISVTVILDGQGIDPNFLNILRPVPGGGSCLITDESDCFLDFSDAQSLGYGGPPPPPSPGDSPQDCSTNPDGPSFFDCEVFDGDESTIMEDAYNAVGSADAYFRRAGAVMGELAFKSGGLFCPLMQPGPVGDYWDHDGDYSPGEECSASTPAECCQEIYDLQANEDAAGRTPCRLKDSARTATMETKSLEYLPKALQAVFCTQNLLGLDPFISTHPLNVVPYNGPPS